MLDLNLSEEISQIKTEIFMWSKRHLTPYLDILKLPHVQSLKVRIECGHSF